MAKQLPPQVQTALLWIKSNMLVVVFCAIVVLVPVGAYFASQKFSEGVRGSAQKRAQVYSELDSVMKAKVELPLPGGQSFPLAGLPNEAVVEEYGQLLTKVSDDARAVYDSARGFNFGSAAKPKHRPIVDASVFPGYSRAKRAEFENVRIKFGDALRQRYEALYEECRTGRPPEPASMTAAIEASEKRFIQGELKQESRAKLNPSQLELVDKHLGKTRIERYFEVAKKISYYLDQEAIEIPTKDAVNRLLAQAKDGAADKALNDQDIALFELQWKHWIVADILRGFASANGATPSVLQAPVKRVMSIKILPPGRAAAAAASADPAADPSAGGSEPASEAPPEGAAPPMADAGSQTTAKLGPPMVDPKVDAPIDYAKSITGRVSNPVYDVRVAQVVFVAETARLPKVLDALAAQNFMTVTNVRLSSADAFQAAREGYLYGAEPVSLVTATVESVWLREWTAPFMPAAVRAKMGILSAPADQGQTDGSQTGM